MKRGLTLNEALVTIVILAVVSALATPVFLRVRANARVASAVSGAKSLYSALTSYRIDYDYVDVYDGARAYYALGLPPGTS